MNEDYEEWKEMSLSEKMRVEIAMASCYADEVAQLEAENKRLLEENKALRQNVSKSVLRRLDAMLTAGVYDVESEE